jgi:hypothetical protein
MTSLRYRRLGDHAEGTSYPMCWNCKPEQIWRLERMGFTMLAGDEPPDAATATRLEMWRS